MVKSYLSDLKKVRVNWGAIHITRVNELSLKRGAASLYVEDASSPDSLARNGYYDIQVTTPAVDASDRCSVVAV